MRPSSDSEDRLLAERIAAAGLLSRSYLDRALAHAREARARGQALTLFQVLRPHLAPETLWELMGRVEPGGVFPTTLGGGDTLGGRATRSAGAPDETPARVGAYLLEGELGRGGMGVVHRGRHESLGTLAAIKLLGAGRGASETQRKRFLREAQAAARLQHPGIVKILDAGEWEGSPYLAMELVEGESLAERLEREGRLPPREAATILQELADALQHAHAHFILHRDVKPANVLLAADGAARLTDFGLARDLSDGSQLTQSGQIVGTPQFMAPEQTGAGGTDRRTDVYGLGATLYALLTGEPPFQGESALQVVAQVVNMEPPVPSTRCPGVPRDLDTIVLKCLEKEPELRYAGAGELAADLGRYLHDEPIVARPPDLGERLGKWRRRNRRAARMLLAAGLGATLSLVALPLGLLRAQRLAREEARAELIGKARDEALAAAERLARAQAEPGASPTGPALSALQAASRWQALDPAGAAAGQALFDAALALGEVARASAQWDLAREAIREAEGLGVDDARAEACAQRVEDERQAEARRKRAEVEAALDQVAAGAARSRPGGSEDAVFAIMRYAEPQTVSLLVARLDAVSEELGAAWERFVLAAEAPDPDEARAGEEPIADLRVAVREHRALEPGQRLSPAAQQALQAAYLRIINRVRRRDPSSTDEPNLRVLAAAFQLRALGPDRLELARVACLALGRIGLEEGACAALWRYLRVEEGQGRALAAGVALVRIGSPRAVYLAHWARRRFGSSSLFSQALSEHLADVQADVPLEGEGPDAYSLRGEGRWAQGDRAGALADYERALELAPTDPRLWASRGLILHELGRYGPARAACDRALELDPQLHWVWTNRALVRLHQEDYQGAVADCEEAMRLRPRWGKPYAIRGQLRRRRGDLEGARVDYERALQLGLHDHQVRANLGGLYTDQGEHGKALAVLQHLVAETPDFARAWRLLGRVHAGLGEAGQALAAYERAIARDPADALAWAGRGEVLWGLRRLEEAEAAYDQAVELAPTAEVLNARGVVRRARGDIPRARADYDRALELDPASSAASMNRSNLRRKQGDAAGAVADARQGLRSDPAHPQLWNALGLALQAACAWEEALEAYARAHELDPAYAQPLYNAGNVHYARGHDRRAIASFDQALALDPEDTWALTNRALARQRAGDVSGALEDLSGALSIQDQDPVTWANRASVRVRLGDLHQGEADARRALALDPTHSGAWSVLVRVAEARDGASAAEAVLARGLEAAPRSPRLWLQHAERILARSEFAEAHAAYERVLELDARQVDAWLGRAVARRALGDLAGGISDLDQAIVLAPGRPELWAQRGETRRRAGQLPAALADCQEALRLAPQHRLARSHRGHVHFDRKDFAAAAADYRALVRAQPQDAHAWYCLGNALVNGGDAPGAREAYDQAIAVNPRHPQAFVNRAQLRRAEGDPQGALADLRQATEIGPRDALAWHIRAEVQRELGQVEAARAAFERVIALLPPTHARRVRCEAELGKLPARSD